MYPYPNILLVVVFKLLIDNVDALDKAFEWVWLLFIELLKAVKSTGAGGFPLSSPD